jgi:two-component system phosphate regulon response regulator PhoB
MSTQVARKAKVLIVEDEPDLAEVFGHVLRKEPYHVRATSRGEVALEEIRRDTPDLIVLDLTLPDMDGLEILKSVRRSPQSAATRVIIVTAREKEVDRIVGLELGADDYVVKPFSPRELVLRARAVLQRDAPAPQGDSAGVHHAGPIEVDWRTYRAAVGGRPLELTLTEFRLLAELVEAGGRVRSRDSLLVRVWGYSSEVMSRTVDTHVRRLRKKLGPAAEWLGTVRGVGYFIRDPHVAK